MPAFYVSAYVFFGKNLMYRKANCTMWNNNILKFFITPCDAKMRKEGRRVITAERMKCPFVFSSGFLPYRKRQPKHNAPILIAQKVSGMKGTFQMYQIIMCQLIPANNHASALALYGFGMFVQSLLKNCFLFQDFSDTGRGC